MSSLNDRLKEVKSSHQRLPIIVSNQTLFPGRDFYAIVDGKNKAFLSLVRSRIDQGEPYFGIVGRADNSTITIGTKAKVTKTELQTNGNATVAVQFRGTDRCFRVRSRPSHRKNGDWYHDHVQYFPKPSPHSPSKLSRIARYKLHRNVRSLRTQLHQYMSLMHIVDPKTLERRLASLGQFPTTQHDQVFWIAAFLDNVQPLLATTFSDRMRLVQTALRSTRRTLYKSILQKYGWKATLYLRLCHKFAPPTSETDQRPRIRRRTASVLLTAAATAAALLVAPHRGAFSAAALMATIMVRVDLHDDDNGTLSDRTANQREASSVVPLGEFE